MAAIKITPDTNVLISSFVCASAVTVKIVELAEEGSVQMFISEVIISEFVRVAEIKFGWSGEKLENISEILRKLCTVVHPDEKIKTVKADPDDDRIIECAVKAGAAYIVTGDKQLLAVKKYRGIRIITPAELITKVIGN